MWITVDKTNILILQEKGNLIFPQIHSPSNNRRLYK